MADDTSRHPQNANSAEVGALLQEGLDLYGEGEVSTAIAIWRSVLELDPGNADAIDFLESADRRSHPRPDPDDPKVAPASPPDIMDEARGLIAAARLEEALELLRTACETSGFRLEMEAMAELVRSRLFRDYLSAIGDLTAVPVQISKAAETRNFNLPSDTGFFLSLVDGATDLENIVAVSGMDGFDALRTTKRLIDLGIVRMRS